MPRISPWDDITPEGTSSPASPHLHVTNDKRISPWGPTVGTTQNRNAADTADTLRAAVVQKDKLQPPESTRIVRTDFFGAIAKNRRNTLLLASLFIILVGAVGYALGALFENSWIHSVTKTVGGYVVNLNDQPPGFLAFTTPKLLGTSILGGIAILWIFYVFLFGDKMVLKMSGAHELTHDAHPMLDNVVTEMALAAGIPKPRVFVIESDGLNAFATGMSPNKSAIAVTRGLLRKLNREELQGVIGHETGHIVNADIRYATMLGVAVGMLLILASLMRRTPRTLLARNGRRKGGSLLVLILVLYLFIAILAPVIAKLLQAAISRQREYMADATSVQLTRNPKGLIRALQKIEGSNGTFLGSSEAFQHMYFCNPYAKLTANALSIFSTHPPTQKRIERLANLG